MARELKDSGIEWIGDIPHNWETIKIKYTSWLKGRIGWQGLTASEYIDEGPFLVTGTDFQNGLVNWSSCAHISKERFDEDSDIHIKEGDLLITKDGTVGKVAIAKNCPDEVSLNSGVLLIRNVGNYKYYDKYLYYVLLSDEFWRWYTLSQTGQSTIKHLYQAQFYSFEYTYPSYEEQVLIANFLDTECSRIDAVIEQTRTSIEEFKKLKQSVMTHAVTKGIHPDRPTKDSGIEWIGDIAADFDLQKLKYLTDILDQFRSPITADQRNQNAEVLYDYYGASGAIDKIDGYTIDDHVMLIGEDGANLRMRNLPLMYEVNGKAWINNHAHILKPKESTHFYYLFYALESIDINPYITGSAQPKLSQENLKNIWLPVPSYEEQAEIANYLQVKIPEMDALIAKKNAFVEALKNYKHSIIYEYVTGKKEVPA